MVYIHNFCVYIISNQKMNDVKLNHKNSGQTF